MTLFNTSPPTSPASPQHQQEPSSSSKALAARTLSTAIKQLQRNLIITSGKLHQLRNFHQHIHRNLQPNH
jgi:hypothetical protein